MASWLSGIVVPYASTFTRSSSAVEALPVRTVWNSLRIASTDLSMCALTSRSFGSFIPILRLGWVGDSARSVPYGGADRLAGQDPAHRAVLLDVEHDDGDVV